MGQKWSRTHRCVHYEDLESDLNTLRRSVVKWITDISRREIELYFQVSSDHIPFGNRYSRAFSSFVYLALEREFCDTEIGTYDR